MGNAKKDWHPADIKASLAKKEYTFARIARELGCKQLTSPNSVLRKPWSHMERIVADIIGRQPSEIWPSRYDRFGKPLRARAARLRTEDGRLSEMKAVSNV